MRMKQECKWLWKNQTAAAIQKICEFKQANHSYSKTDRWSLHAFKVNLNLGKFERFLNSFIIKIYVNVIPGGVFRSLLILQA